MKKGARRMKLSHSTQRKKHVRGGGYSDVKPMLYYGGLTHAQYDGPGKDCAGVPVRPGMMGQMQIGSMQRGLPGLSGGGSTMRKRRGGASQLGSGGAVVMSGGRGSTTGAASELAQISPAPIMRGGRWGAFPGAGIYNPASAVGAAGYAPIGRVACESGTTNSMNPNPGGIQSMTTAVPSVPGWTPFGAPLKGGARRKYSHKHSRKCSHKRRKQQGGAAAGGVMIGEADAMRYYAQTAGYSSVPLSPAVQQNPGIQMQLGYPARQFNQACMNTH